MKANELRIGNYVGFPSGATYIVDMIYSDYEGLSYWKPIPLTEELLLRLEAVKLDFKDYPSYNLKGIQINFINGMWIEYVSRIEITGLHHLQNIFYFRMNEELTINK